jgi:hypothetical protein
MHQDFLCLLMEIKINRKIFICIYMYTLICFINFSTEMPKLCLMTFLTQSFMSLAKRSSRFIILRAASKMVYICEGTASLRLRKVVWNT